MEEHEGGPKKWEAHEVRHEIRATMFVVARFRRPSSHPPPTDASIPATNMDTGSTPSIQEDQQRDEEGA